MSVWRKNNVHVVGGEGPPMVLAHGFGCDQNMWRLIVPAFEDRYRVVLFDHVGMGQSDPSAYDVARHSSLAGYAHDVLEICRALDLERPILVGHSVSAMIGVLAVVALPDYFGELVLVSPSPRFIDDRDYVGGFSRQQIEELLDFLDANYLGWARAMAPVIMGNPDRPELTEELVNSFCRSDPEIAKRFARVTFLADHRADLPHVRCPTLVLQSSVDALAPPSVGEYVHHHIEDSTLVVLRATGHCPHLSAPAEVSEAVDMFLRRGGG
jgi:sigma-B regulation protein RsbQ